MPPPSFEILSGLPPYGPDAEPFTATGQGTQREGLVVRIATNSDDSWVGNFQPGLGTLSPVYAHPNERELIVVARGQGYVVDPDDRTKRQYLGSQIESVIVADEPSMVILGNGLWLEAIGASGPAWRTPRISWDGMRNLALNGPTISGEAWSALEDRWISFTLDVTTGKVVGGAFGAK